MWGGGVLLVVLQLRFVLLSEGSFSSGAWIQRSASGLGLSRRDPEKKAGRPPRGSRPAWKCGCSRAYQGEITSSMTWTTPFEVSISTALMRALAMKTFPFTIDTGSLAPDRVVTSLSPTT